MEHLSENQNINYWDYNSINCETYGTFEGNQTYDVCVIGTGF